MIATETAALASLTMYPFDQIRDAWEHVYSVVAAHVAGSPSALRWDLDPQASWESPQLALGMTCGWPLVVSLRRRVRVVGAFVFDLDARPDHRYRSVIVARRDATIAEMAHAPAAINSVDSLSGHISLVATLPGSARSWPGPVLWTGAHRASIDEVRAGRADIASIDAVTWALLARDEPSAIDGLVIIGRGPEVPTLPLITNGGSTDADIGRWRKAFTDATGETALRPDLERLLIRGFVSLDLVDYDTELADLVDRFAQE